MSNVDIKRLYVEGCREKLLHRKKGPTDVRARDGTKAGFHHFQIDRHQTVTHGYWILLAVNRKLQRQVH